MLVVVQFPLTDIRPFLDEAEARLVKPVWPIVNVPDDAYRAPFVRGFGRAFARNSGGVIEWPAEDAFCAVAHAVRLQQSVLKTASQICGFANAYCAFRRLFWDGKFGATGSVVGRVEIGFVFRGLDKPLSGQQLGALLDSLLRQKVGVKPFWRGPAATGAQKALSLNDMGQALSRAYTRATSPTKCSEQSDAKGYVQAASPSIIVDFARNTEVASIPSGAKLLALTQLQLNGVRVFNGARNVDGRRRSVWYFESDPVQFDRDGMRRLRVNVTRLQSTMASLKILVDLGQKGQLAPKLEAPKKRLDDCLGQMLPILYKKSALGFSMTPFLEAALRLDEAINAGQLATLRALYPEAGRGLRAQMERADSAVAEHLARAPFDWEIFIAHASDDKFDAEKLYDLLNGQILTNGAKARVFLDSRSVAPGDNWNKVIPAAQERALITVVLVGSTVDHAYYLQSEIAAAIAMSRVDEQRRVIPIYLQGGLGRQAATPYGLNIKQGLEVSTDADLAEAAARLIESLNSALVGPA